MEDMARGSIHGVTEIAFTIQSKEEMATILREKMRNQEIKIPYVPTKRIHDVELTSELNIEKHELLKPSHLRFSHPEGSHDDVFWSLALAVYASVQAPLRGRGIFFVPH